MKENSYTKGEWKYSQYYFDDARGSIFMDNKEGACTIELRGAMAMSQEELNSHAQLIAAAPELLEALTEFKHWYLTCSHMNPPIINQLKELKGFNEIINKMASAENKAEGV